VIFYRYISYKFILKIMEEDPVMIKKICIYSIIILSVCFARFSNVVAHHDNEAIGKGGAWESDEKTDRPASAANEESIKNKLDKAFQKSPIIIPEIDKDPIEEDSEDSVDPENNDMDSSGTAGQ